ncbi:MAG TPA: hypothetical protein VGW38_20410 [Chloroflexota bacterium]|nr:hypothetical protein [Chloroflexota bacterium]
MPRILQISCLAACLFIAAQQPAEARRGSGGVVAAAFGSCGNPCVITYSPGGNVATFMSAAQAVRAGAKKLVVIDGPCISACAIFADVARAKVCITDRAKFGFHKASGFTVQRRADGRAAVRALGRRDPPHSRDIARWVQQRGGFPRDGLRVMTAREAGQFWRRCSM